MNKVLLLANRDFVLYNFRFELIEKLIDEGIQVYISLPYGPKVEHMIKAGAIFKPIEVDSRGMNVIHDIKLLHELKDVFRDVSPDVVLLYTTKTNIYGGIIARLMKIPYMVNVSGLGSEVVKKGIWPKLILSLYLFALNKSICVFFQNRHNQNFFHKRNIRCRKERLIPGSGVNTNYWNYIEYPSETNGIHFLFIARLIKEKGIEEYLEVASAIKLTKQDAFFHIIGPCDGDYRSILEKYEKKGTIIYHGMVEDTRGLLGKAHCLIHPSYYPEGVSNVCLEASACGRPVITTDNPGCKETVIDGKTGYIVPAKNTTSMIQAVMRFICLPESVKRQMGIDARDNVAKKFNRNTVIDIYLEEIREIVFN